MQIFLSYFLATLAVYDYKKLFFIAFFGIFNAIKDYKTTFMSNFGENLKQIRTVKNISQGKLAKLMDIHATHISRYERNLTIPSIDVVKKLADILEVSTDDLVYGNLGEKANNKIQDSELLSIFSKAQNLEQQDKDCIKSLLKAFIFQKEMQKQLAS